MSSTLANILPETKHISSAQRLRKPKTNTIPLLSSDLAKYYSYAHTVQLLSYYYLRSGYLVADPLATLLQDLVPLAVSQCIFCALCLPSVGNWNSGTHAGEMIKGSASSGSSRTQKAGSGTPKKRLGVPSTVKSSAKTAVGVDVSKDIGGSRPSRILPTTLALILSFLIPPVPLMAFALILGAPLYPTYLLPHTLALSAHVSLLAALPIFYTHGVSAAAWKDVSAAWLPFDDAGVWGGAVGALVGGWFGAIPIALDWDREWQKWPCTVLWGAVMGWGVGRILTNVLKIGIGRRIDLSLNEYPPPEIEVEKQKEQKKFE